MDRVGAGRAWPRGCAPRSGGSSRSRPSRRRSACGARRGRRARRRRRSRSRARGRCGRCARRSRRGSPPGASGSSSLRIVLGRDTLARSMRRLLLLLAFVLLVPAGAGERRHALPDRRPRLGARRRDEPVRRARLRAGGLGLRADPRALLPRHDAARRPGPAGARAARRGAGCGRRSAPRSPFSVVDARGKVRKLKPGAQKLVAAKLAQLRSPLRFVAGRGAAPARRRRLSRRADRPPRGAQADRRQPAPARPLPPRRRPRGRCRTTGIREALRAQAVVARSYALATLKPGTLFDLYADTRSQVYGGVQAEEDVDEPGDRLHRRPGAVFWNGPGRDDLLPLDVGRPDGLDRRSVAECRAGAVPRLRRRPVRHALEASPLGAVPADARAGGGKRRRSGGSATSSSRAGRRDASRRCG